MEQEESDECCEIGVKSSCVNCDYNSFCNGKWSHHELF